jgi:CheY-like chemotaxis protein
MDDDLVFVSVKLLIVSDAAAEREVLRSAAARASIPLEITEAAAGEAGAEARDLLAKNSYDIVFFDSRMSKIGRQILLEAIRTAPSRPLAILIGAAALKTREVLTGGMDIDGALAKPIVFKEPQELLEHCIRARRPNRVLIVDDSSTLRSVIRKVLQATRFNCDPEEAEDGAAAIERARRENFDIVFLDCQMPGIDGFDTLQQLKRMHPDAKVVMITGTRDVRIEDRARAEGPSDFLYKPFFAKDMDAVLNRLFGLMRPRWN